MGPDDEILKNFPVEEITQANVEAQTVASEEQQRVQDVALVGEVIQALDKNPVVEESYSTSIDFNGFSNNGMNELYQATIEAEGWPGGIKLENFFGKSTPSNDRGEILTAPYEVSELSEDSKIESALFITGFSTQPGERDVDLSSGTHSKMILIGANPASAEHKTVTAQNFTRGVVMVRKSEGVDIPVFFEVVPAEYDKKDENGDDIPTSRPQARELGEEGRAQIIEELKKAKEHFSKPQSELQDQELSEAAVEASQNNPEEELRDRFVSIVEDHVSLDAEGNGEASYDIQASEQIIPVSGIRFSVFEDEGVPKKHTIGIEGSLFSYDIRWDHDKESFSVATLESGEIGEMTQGEVATVLGIVSQADKDGKLILKKE